MCDFGLDGLSSGRSPDRLDALVWAVTELNRTDARGDRGRGPAITFFDCDPTDPRPLIFRREKGWHTISSTTRSRAANPTASEILHPRVAVAVLVPSPLEGEGVAESSTNSVG